MTDRLARLADERVDVAIRLGALEDSSLISRVLRRTRWVTVGAPSYLARNPAPKSPGDLAAHNCLRFLGPNGKPRDWTFKKGSRTTSVVCGGNLLIDHGSYLLGAAEAGLGLCQVLDFMVESAVAEGRLVEVLEGQATSGPVVHGLTTLGRASSPNVRALMRFLSEVFAA
jgi:DNA-binding transcriptional LysR family regulator